MSSVFDPQPGGLTLVWLNLTWTVAWGKWEGANQNFRKMNYEKIDPLSSMVRKVRNCFAEVGIASLPRYLPESNQEMYVYFFQKSRNMQNCISSWVVTCLDGLDSQIFLIFVVIFILKEFFAYNQFGFLPLSGSISKWIVNKASFLNFPIWLTDIYSWIWVLLQIWLRNIVLFRPYLQTASLSSCSI